MEKTFAIRYISGNDSDKYVGSVMDYQDGGVADPVMMTEKDARELFEELNKYVEAEFIGKNELDNEQAHWAFHNGDWGFVLEEIEYPILDDDEEEVEEAHTGLDRSSRAKPYVVGRMIAIVEHYAKHRFGPLTLSNMFSHPRTNIEAFSRYVDKDDEFYKELEGIQLPITARNMVEQGQEWIGYYHQKSAYDKAEPQGIAKTLKDAREASGMSLRALSEKTCINISNLSGIESGKTSPTVDTLQKIADALGLQFRLE